VNAPPFCDTAFVILCIDIRGFHSIDVCHALACACVSKGQEESATHTQRCFFVSTESERDRERGVSTARRKERRGPSRRSDLSIGIIDTRTVRPQLKKEGDVEETTT